ncbi:hypothetical protein B0T25DRAFT_268208 [Lasiosphaeria hispida]|uniref:Secreted protein n=1 Tax=Lasiosphaeria hispida TaxID=260671 RepID=A0AAJ0HAM0_9PEZI|nr:hypothetical protein B0T25DRAFT_268208 [Lasiosphaeria hispida]
MSTVQCTFLNAGILCSFFSWTCCPWDQVLKTSHLTSRTGKESERVVVKCAVVKCAVKYPQSVNLIALEKSTQAPTA